jgi:hypothetical protein
MEEPRTRDDLLHKVRYGEMTPDQAEACEPNDGTFDPMGETLGSRGGRRSWCASTCRHFEANVGTGIIATGGPTRMARIIRDTSWNSGALPTFASCISMKPMIRCKH